MEQFVHKLILELTNFQAVYNLLTTMSSTELFLGILFWVEVGSSEYSLFYFVMLSKGGPTAFGFQHT